MTTPNSKSPSAKSPFRGTQSPDPLPLEAVADTARLMRRKKFTGEELGRILLLSFVHDFRQREKAQAVPLLSQDQLLQMVSRLPSDYERDIYQQYAAVYEQLVSLFRQSQGLLQQLLHGLCRLSYPVSMAEKVLLLQRRVLRVSGLDGDPSLPEDIHNLFPDNFENFLSRPAQQTELRGARDLMVMPSYAELTAYNAMLETLAAGLSLPELLELSAPLKDVLIDASAYDEMLARCYAALPAQHASAFKAFCPPLALESIQPDVQAMAQFIAQLKATGPDPAQLVRALRPDWQEVAHG